jgi:hypothetical protein
MPSKTKDVAKRPTGKRLAETPARPTPITQRELAVLQRARAKLEEWAKLYASPHEAFVLDARFRELFRLEGQSTVLAFIRLRVEGASVEPGPLCMYLGEPFLNTGFDMPNALGVVISRRQ